MIILWNSKDRALWWYDGIWNAPGTVTKATVTLNKTPSIFSQYNYVIISSTHVHVQQRRRLLVPVMKQAQKNGHLAILAFDKLYVDEKLYDPKDPVCVASVERNVRQRRRHNDRRQSSNSMEYEHVPYRGQNANGSPKMNRQTSDRAGQPGRSFTPPGTSSWGTNGAAVHDTGARPKTTFSGPAFGASYSSMASENMDTTAPRSLIREAAATSTSQNTSYSNGVD